MRKIVTRGLYTYMEGMCPGTKFAGNVEMNEPLKQDKNKSLEGLCVDGCGKEEGIAQNSRTATHGLILPELLRNGFRAPAEPRTTRRCPA
jgi:hypothetical protein